MNRKNLSAKSAKSANSRRNEVKLGRFSSLETNPYSVVLPPLVKKPRSLNISPIKSQPTKSNPTAKKLKFSSAPQSTTTSFDSSEIIDVESLVLVRVKKMKPNEFIYLSYAYPQSDVNFSAYSLVEVPYSQIDKTGFFTLSREGLTYWGLTENHFTYINDWYIEYKKYCRLKMIKIFKYFRLWKGFKVWQKTIQWKKIDEAKKFLEQNLFTANPCLAKALLKIQEEFCQLKSIKLTTIDELEDWHLFYFYEAQITQIEYARNLLFEFRERMKIVLYEACYDAMRLKGFSDEMIKDDIVNSTSSRRVRDQISFTDRASKRNYCARLTTFLGLCDVMTINLLYMITKNSFSDLSFSFEIHAELGPSIETITSNRDIHRQLEDERPEDYPQSPFFVAELNLLPDVIEIKPSQSISEQLIEQIVDLIMESSHLVRSFQSDSHFTIFTEPSFMGHKEERLYRRPPNINFLFNIDVEFNEEKNSIMENLNSAYEKINTYILRFEQIRENYQEDMVTDKEALRSESNLDKLITYCKRYTSEINALDELLPSCNLGIFKLKQDTFKEKIVPKCKELLSILEQLLPRLAKETVREVKIKAENVMTKLTTHPDDTKKFVQYLDYIELKCPEILQQIEKTLEYALIALQIMKEYEISVDEEDKENYFHMEDFFRQLNKEWNEKCDSRAKLIVELSESLQSDIQRVIHEINDVLHEVKKSWLLESSSNYSHVSEFLAELTERLFQCQDNCQIYREYQLKFQLEETKFDILDEVQQEVKYRQMLWDSYQGWKDSVSMWNETPFNKLDVSAIIEMNLKILRNCFYLEKKLPKNDIIPKLKSDAEEFKDKIPTLQCLRSSDLKPRHWLKVEQLLDRRLLGLEGLCLYTFEDANAFESHFSSAIQDIHSHAKSEAQLEESIKRIENTWKMQELSLAQHRDMRNVFVLTGISELQSILDDSCVTITNIAASRHIGSLKSRVDDWIKSLELFGQIFDEWLVFQTKWIHLEAIFSAPDIGHLLPHEAKMFSIVDKWYRELMGNIAKKPLAYPAMTNARYLENFKQSTILLEQVSRCMELYLEAKRDVFPRFYFLSNEEVLAIYVQTKNHQGIQGYFRKCFEGISHIEFGTKRNEKQEILATNDIIAMHSVEGERVQFGKGLRARGAVEDWLTKVDEGMILAMKRCMKFAYQCYSTVGKPFWFREHPSQVVLTISQQQWTVDVHAAFDDNSTSDSLKLLRKLQEKLEEDLLELSALARTHLPALIRNILSSLIIVDIHSKDTVAQLIEKEVTAIDDFEWTRLMRYYWKDETDTMTVQIGVNSFPYYYEYLGTSGVQVMTPLTDRCFLAMTNAIKDNFGGILSGASGTGKTETIKELAKALAIHCVIFNCSERLTAKFMGRFFTGLVQSGAFCCLDEFNRIDVQVLSVIAQQLITIRNAKMRQLQRFIFEGKEIKLNESCATFVTMNPRYQEGRSQLPNNLKNLFRPISMTTPDQLLIALVLLHSEGFKNSQSLAQKLIRLYQLCNQLCSKQIFYDFGIRTLRKTLLRAGMLKKDSSMGSESDEEIILLNAVREVNIPKLIPNDLQIFEGILNDLFPDTEIHGNSHFTQLQTFIENHMLEKNLQALPALISKHIQLYESLLSHVGIVLIGESASGKTTIYQTLAECLGSLNSLGHQGQLYKSVNIQIINPKSITLDELFGAFDSATTKWQSGLLEVAVKKTFDGGQETNQWIVLDGGIDAQWVENLNLVLDDNQTLTLSNSERIKLSPWNRFIFETDDLSNASPATISRCGIVYVNHADLRWHPVIASWLQQFDEQQLNLDLKDFLKYLFSHYFDEFMNFAKYSCDCVLEQVDLSKVVMLCRILKNFIDTIPSINSLEISEAKKLICKIWIWASLWSIGCNMTEPARELLENQVRKFFQQSEFANLPQENLWLFQVDIGRREFVKWEVSEAELIIPVNAVFSEIFVPTLDSLRFGHISHLLLRSNLPVMFVGKAGIGKSTIALETLKSLPESDFITQWIHFSANTSSLTIQNIIESKLEKRKKSFLGAPIGKKIIVFMDDINLPRADDFGAQQPIELLRQFMDFRGFYHRKDWSLWFDVEDVLLSGVCSQFGSKLSKRFLRHFALLAIPTPDTEKMTTTAGRIITGFFSNFVKGILSLSEPLTSAVVSIYEKVSLNFLPTPTKSHYLFNFRDLSKCIQGLLQASPSCYNTASQMLRLFYHESLRVYYDRLVDDHDRNSFKDLMKEVCMKYFESEIIGDDEVLLYGDFMVHRQTQEDRTYEEIKELDKLKEILNDFLEDYNSISGKNIKMIFFQDAVEHCLKIARILRMERGNALLIGLPGMGKQSLSRLATHINCYQFMQIDTNRNFTHSTFRDDLRKCYWNSGIQNFPTTFLIPDSRILENQFLEDLNGILNLGEPRNLFEGEEYEKVILNSRSAMIETGTYKDQTKDEIYEYFLSRVKSNLHIIICMNPTDSDFRQKCCTFPALINSCTIDWFTNWPAEALYSVAFENFRTVTENEDESKSLSRVCVVIHESVETASLKMRQELQRFYYPMPSSYLDLIYQYHSLLGKRTEKIVLQKDQISNGLTKLLDTNEVITIMNEDLKKFAPIIEEKSNNIRDLLSRLEKDYAQAEIVKKTVSEEEAEAKIKAIATQELSVDKDLEIVMPTLRTALDALRALNKNDINEIKVFQKPPKLVQLVMDAICILMNVKPEWNSAKQIMSDNNFLKKLTEYDVNHIPEATLKKVKPYIDSKDFQPPIVEKVSKVCSKMCLWIIAVDKYAKVYKAIEPKIKKRDAMESELRQCMINLKRKQNELAEVEDKIQKIRDTLEDKQQELQEIQDRFDLTNVRLNRATRLQLALADEEMNWRESVRKLESELWAIPGDVLLASAYIAYLGAFPINYRRNLTQTWNEQCQLENISCSSEFSFIHCVGDDFEIREWTHDKELFNDEISIENGIIVKHSNKTVLLIDPQEQGNQWIRNLEAENELVVVQQTEPTYIRTIEMAIVQGKPVLLEDVGEKLDRPLNPIITKVTYFQGGKMFLRLGDRDIEYNSKFRLYMTSKLSNPHYTPETCIQVTLVDFSISPQGLESKLLSDITNIEIPDIERQRKRLIANISEDKKQFHFLNEKILELLFTSEGNILDDEELVETLNESKETSTVIANRLIDAEKSEQSILEEREKYEPLSQRGSKLFFVLLALADIDPIYQYSLSYFSRIFCGVLQLPHPKTTLEERIEFLLKEQTCAVYCNILKGLFERHKPIFSFLLATAIDGVTEEDVNFLLQGSQGMTEKPNQFEFLTDTQWSNCVYLAEHHEAFAELPNNLHSKIGLTLGPNFSVKLNEAGTEEDIDWNSKLSAFQKLMLISILTSKPTLNQAIEGYIEEILGSELIHRTESHSSLETFPNIPTIFILSEGAANPLAIVQKYAKECNINIEKLQTISLGQGQKCVAIKHIEKARKTGKWIYLQNCHLAAPWMSNLEAIVRNITTSTQNHESFRLFLSMMPGATSSFPVSILRDSTKITVEQPRGLKSSLLKSLNNLDEDRFEIHVLAQQWRSIIFGLCLFHSILLERKRIGFNLNYEFSELDLDYALNILEIYVDREEKTGIPWNAVNYFNKEVVYGGHVDDPYDQLCLNTLLEKFLSENILESDYKYSDALEYQYPSDLATLQKHLEFTSTFPSHDRAEIFGLHENSNIIYNTNETNFFISTLLTSQNSSSIRNSLSNDENCVEKISAIRFSLPQTIDENEIHSSFKMLDAKGSQQSLTTVLYHEIECFNKLLSTIHESLKNVDNAIKGLTVMTEDIEETLKSIQKDHVPQQWKRYSYLSVKMLGNWTTDLKMRIEHIENWIKSGFPHLCWISGLFHPQTFLSGVLQMHARKHNLSIDCLKFDYEVTDKILCQQEIYEKGLNTEDLIDEFAEDEILIYGIFINAAKWNSNENHLQDVLPGMEIITKLPTLRLTPTTDVAIDRRAAIPFYHIQPNQLKLSEIDYLTNHITTIPLNSKLSNELLTLRGVCLLTMYSDL